MKAGLLSFIFLLVFSCAEKKSDPKPDDGAVINPGDSFPVGCVAIDTDGDGIIDCLDPDIDGDGRTNPYWTKISGQWVWIEGGTDAFPFDPTEWIDSDGDGVGDNSDVFPYDASEWTDTDSDGVGNNSDEDDDNDGIPDNWDALPRDKDNWTDIIRTGLGDQTINEDADNDGVPNRWDALPWDMYEWFDINLNGLGDNVDPDIDGDGHPNNQDDFPYDAAEWRDTNGDGIGDNADPDDDNDGFPDTWEDFSLNVSEMWDSDGDGFGNNVDRFPFDPTEWSDSDGDGIGDNSDVFPTNPNEWKDTDGDGIGDNSDDDVDGDGFINCIPYHTPNLDPSFPACNQDAFPLDREEWRDTDGNGIGDNSDEDIDGDGIPNKWDYFPLEKYHWTDFDRDGIPDSTFPNQIGSTPVNFSDDPSQLPTGNVFFIFDEDLDNDGVPNQWDYLNYNSQEWFDIDGDGIGDNIDPDIDGDGVPNETDAFPYNPDESQDSDGDGIGDNLDFDNDNDGMPNLWDDLPYNIQGYSSFVFPVPDQVVTDIDGDGIINDVWQCTLYTRTVYNDFECGFKDYELNFNPVRPNYPKYGFFHPTIIKDNFIWDADEFYDTDQDGLGDNLADEDSDNDGVPDAWDAFPRDRNERYGWFDIDGDTIPNETLYKDYITGLWLWEYDTDIDGDGIEQGPFSCQVMGIDHYLCSYDLYRMEGGVKIYYDEFPYNPIEWRDTDGDGIGDNTDGDVDGDGVVNCIPYHTPPLDPSYPSCNQDLLPTVGSLHEFVLSATYDDNGNLIKYCANLSNCYYTNYDRDSDGLSDYEEYLHGTNPMASDTDGDGVPDNVEISEGTNPLDPNSWLDDDEDGIPNFVDLTPYGANNPQRLYNQINNANNCRTKLIEESCVDATTGLCKWDASEGICGTNPIRITEDIVMDRCLSIDHDVSIHAIHNKKLIFNASTSCTGLAAPFTGSIFSSLNLQDMIIESQGFSSVIKTDGHGLELDNVSILATNTSDIVKIIEHNRSLDGSLRIQRSSIRSISERAFTNNMVFTNISNLDIKGSLFSCEITDLDNSEPEANCLHTFAKDTIFADSVLNYTAKFEPEIGFNYGNGYAWEVFSDDISLLGDITGASHFDTIKATGDVVFNHDRIRINSPISILVPNPVDPMAEDVPKSIIIVNNINEMVETSDNSQLFSSSDSNSLMCVNTVELEDEDGDPFDNIFLANFLFDASPIQTHLNYKNMPFFNSQSVDGIYFPTGDNTVFKNAFTVATDTNSNPYFDYNQLVLGADFVLIPASSSQPSGIASVPLMVSPNSQLSFVIDKSERTFNNIVAMLMIYNHASGEMIKRVFIREKLNSELLDYKVVEPSGDITYYVGFNNSEIKETITLPANGSIRIHLQNFSNAESDDIEIRDLSLKTGTMRAVQYPGYKHNMCE